MSCSAPIWNNQNRRTKGTSPRAGGGPCETPLLIPATREDVLGSHPMVIAVSSRPIRGIRAGRARWYCYHLRSRMEAARGCRFSSRSAWHGFSRHRHFPRLPRCPPSSVNRSASPDTFTHAASRAARRASTVLGASRSAGSSARARRFFGVHGGGRGSPSRPFLISDFSRSPRCPSHHDQAEQPRLLRADDETGSKARCAMFFVSPTAAAKSRADVQSNPGCAVD